MRPSTERPAHIMATWLSSVSFQTSNFHQKHQFISPTSMSSFKSSKDLLKSQRISCNPVLVSDSSSLSEIEPPSDVGLPARRPSILVDLWRRKLRIMEFRTQSCKTLKKAGVISHCQPCTIAGWTAHAVSPWSQPLGLDCPDGRANARGCHRNSPEHAIMKFIQVIEIWWKLMEIDGNWWKLMEHAVTLVWNFTHFLPSLAIHRCQMPSGWIDLSQNPELISTSKLGPGPWGVWESSVGMDGCGCLQPLGSNGTANLEMFSHLSPNHLVSSKFRGQA